MRIFLSTLLLSAAVAANPAAQGSPQSPASSPQPDATGSGGLMQEPRILTRGIEFIERRVGDGQTSRDGFYPDFNGPITGSGWIAIGPGYRRRLLNGRALIDGSATISWRTYKEAQARFELTDLADGHLLVGAQGRWQDLTQIDYYGLGAGSLESQRSKYRLKGNDVMGYANVRTSGPVTIGGRFGWLQKPGLSSPVGPFRGDFASVLEMFASEAGVSDPTSYLHGDVSVTADTRDHAGHPTRGGMYRASAAVYSDRDLDAFNFRRYEAEAVQLAPVMGPKWLVALHGWAVFSDTSSGNEVPFYMLPSLGGQNTLRGYHDYRFHDRNLLLLSGESRWAVWEHMDAAVFFDAGNVASRVSDLNLRKTSYGAGVRVHTATSTFARLDVGHSREGYEVVFRLTDPFRLARRTERATIAPFVP